MSGNTKDPLCLYTGTVRQAGGGGGGWERTHKKLLLKTLPANPLLVKSFQFKGEKKI